MGEEHISVGKKTKGKKNETAHNPRMGLGLTNNEIMAAWKKEKKKNK